jgi:hypothetical protein
MKEILLTRGYVALVDDEDYERVIAAGPWRVAVGRHTMYAQRHVHKPDGKWTTQRMHRFLLGVTNPKIQVDHRNHTGLDNQQPNIHRCLNGHNQANSRKRSGTSSRFRGVHWDKCRGKWKARLQIDGKRLSLGYFTDEVAAALAYDAAARELFGEFANLNFPDGGVNEQTQQERNGW